MRTRTITLIEFDGLEWQRLKRVEPSIRIAFPTDEADQMYRADRPKRDINAWWARWPGRKLQQLCKQRQEWEPVAIWEAWDALVDLEAILEAQSDRAYWERTLMPDPADPANVTGEQLREAGSAVGLVAPGTDVCGMLAGTRRSQLRDVRDALPLLAEAKRLVGARPEPRVPLKLEQE